MNCDYVQEELSAFLDREESSEHFDDVLSHLYGCKSCQDFFGSAARMRSLAGKDVVSYPVELDALIRKRTAPDRKVNVFGYRLKLPLYVVSAAAVVLLVVSFVFGYMMQEGVHRKEINAILKAQPSQVVYGMPAQVVYPIAMHESKGVSR